MKITTRVRILLLMAFTSLCQSLPVGAADPIRVETGNLLVLVDAANCRWSAQVKGTPMQLNDVYFLPGNDPSGWKVASSVNLGRTSPYPRVLPLRELLKARL
jgi:hypothetical protein